MSTVVFKTKKSGYSKLGDACPGMEAPNMLPIQVRENFINSNKAEAIRAYDMLPDSNKANFLNPRYHQPS